MDQKAFARRLRLSGWFNSLEGLNDWAGGEIDIVGRPLPAPLDVEDIARAIHQDGDPIVPVGAWYPKRPIALVGGVGMSWCERHIDPRVEDVRWVICEGAMMQAAARARHVRRGCKIRLFTSMVLPIRVDEVQQFDSLHPKQLEYDFAPVRTSAPKLAQRLFRKFEGMSAPGIKGAIGGLFEWAMDHEAEFIEVRLQGEKHWSRVWIAEGGWRWLCDRVAVVDWRYAVQRKDDHPQRFEAMRMQSEHVDELRALREAFEREPWLVAVSVWGGAVTPPRIDAFAAQSRGQSKSPKQSDSVRYPKACARRCSFSGSRSNLPSSGKTVACAPSAKITSHPPSSTCETVATSGQSVNAAHISRTATSVSG